jgi:hypothetical protein
LAKWHNEQQAIIERRLATSVNRASTRSRTHDSILLSTRALKSSRLFHQNLPLGAILTSRLTQKKAPVIEPAGFLERAFYEA